MQSGFAAEATPDQQLLLWAQLTEHLSQGHQLLAGHSHYPLLLPLPTFSVLGSLPERCSERHFSSELALSLLGCKFLAVGSHHQSHPSAVFTPQSPVLWGQGSNSLIFQPCLGFCYNFHHDLEWDRSERERWGRGGEKISNILSLTDFLL